MTRLAVLLASASAATIAFDASAQIYDDLANETVRERPRPEYDPQGIFLGRFIARPDFQFGVQYEDNVFAREEETQEDLIGLVRAAGTITSDWQRHEAHLFYSADYNYYTDIEDETNAEYTLGLRGRLDVFRDSSLTAQVSYSRLAEDRLVADTVLFTELEATDLRDNFLNPALGVVEDAFSEGVCDAPPTGARTVCDALNAAQEAVDAIDGRAAVFADEPIEYNVLQTSLTARHTLDQLRLIAGVRATGLTYEDATVNLVGQAQQSVSDAVALVVDEFGGAANSAGLSGEPLARLNQKGVIDQSFRDHTILRSNVRGEYQFTPGAYVLAEVVYKTVDFTDPQGKSVYFVDDGGQQVAIQRVDRSSEGFEVLGGIGFDLTRLLRGEIGGRFVSETYESDRFDDVTGAGISGDLTWLVSPLTNLTLAANTEVRPTTLEGASGILATSSSVMLDHEFSRNIIFYGELKYFLEDYQELDREDSRFEYGLGLLYLLDNRYSIEMNAARTEQESTGVAGRDFDVNRVSASLQVRF